MTTEALRNCPETVLDALPETAPHLWYETLNALCRTLAGLYGLPLETVAGIVVTFSAQKAFSENLTQTVQFLAGLPLTGLYSRAQVRTAEAIRAGLPPLEAWAPTSHKYRNFYLSILLDPNAVCVDSHIIKHYLARHPRSRVHRIALKDIFKTRWAYELIQRYVRKTARAWGMTPYQAQAAIWVQQRQGQMW